MKSTELFRFVLVRPADKQERVTKVNYVNVTESFTAVGYQPKDIVIDDVLNYGKIFHDLDQAGNLKSNIKTVIESVEVGNKDWTFDKNVLDGQLISIYKYGRDEFALGPKLSRYRQLYDVVERASKNADDIEVLPLSLEVEHKNVEQPKSIEQPRGPVRLFDAKQVSDLNRAIDLLQSPKDLQKVLAVDPLVLRDDGNHDAAPLRLTLKQDWYSVLPIDTQVAVQRLVGTNMLSVHEVYHTLIEASRSVFPKYILATRKNGLYSIGPFHVELTDMPDLSLPVQTELERVPGSDVLFTGFGDLLVVRERPLHYEGGDISNIQNVLKSEILKRETKHFTETVDTLTTSEENTREEQHDSQTTDRFSLSNESSNVLKESTSLKAGLSVSAKYGPYVEVHADASVAQDKSSEDSSKTAAAFSKEVTSRASLKVIEKILRSRTIQTTDRFEENFTHEFNNVKDGASNISGVYQWINKVTQAQTYNYGKRWMIDFIVPEPAAFSLDVASGKSDIVAEKPIPLTETAMDINESNYAQIAARYNVTGMKAPPEYMITVSKALTEKTGEQPGVLAQAADVVVSAGYASVYATIVVIFVTLEVGGGQSLFPTVDVAVGGMKSRLGISSGSSVGAAPVEKTTYTGSTTNLSTGTISVGFVAEHTRACTAFFEVTCVRTQNAYDTWRLTVYDQIVLGYMQMKNAYDKAVAQATADIATSIRGQNPGNNSNIVFNEIKKACISMIRKGNFDAFGAIKKDNDGYWETDLSKAELQGPYIRFFEQAFEWENMQYLFYPYYWGRKSQWKVTSMIQDNDPDFASFLRAGASRVVLPVRSNFHDDVAYFLNRGKVWGGGPLPSLRDPRYISIAQELEKMKGKQGDEVSIGEPWEVRVPTNLVRLRTDGELPSWGKDSRGEWTEL